MAYHYVKAQEAAKAVTYLTITAQQAMQRYAHHEALMMLQEAIVHAARLPHADRDRCCLEIAIRQADALFWLGRHQEIVDLLLAQQERLERQQRPELTGEYCLWLGVAHAFLGHWEAAWRHCQRALEEGTRCGDAVITGIAHAHISMILFFSHSLPQSIAHGWQAVSLLEQQSDRPRLGRALFFLGFAYTLAGEFQRAQEAAERLHAISDTIGDRRLQVNALSILGLSAITQGEWAAGMEATRLALDLAPDAFETSYLHGLLGYAYVEKGDPTEAIPRLERAVRETEQYHARHIQCVFRVMLGAAYRLDGQFEPAQDLARQSLEMAQQDRNGHNIGRAQRLLGRIAQARGHHAEAESHLQKALATFSSMGARFDVGCTDLDLAIAAHHQGNPGAASTHLSNVHAMFTVLQAPTYEARATQLAREYGIALTAEPPQA